MQSLLMKENNSNSVGRHRLWLGRLHRLVAPQAEALGALFAIVDAKLDVVVEMSTPIEIAQNFERAVDNVALLDGRTGVKQHRQLLPVRWAVSNEKAIKHWINIYQKKFLYINVLSYVASGAVESTTGCFLSPTSS